MLGNLCYECVTDFSLEGYGCVGVGDVYSLIVTRLSPSSPKSIALLKLMLVGGVAYEKSS